MKKLNALRFLFLGFIFSSNLVKAAQVQAVKETKVLIDLEEDSAEPGQEFFLLSQDGVKKAIIKITQTRSGKAVAEITKGQAQKGMTLLSKSSTKKVTKKISDPVDEDEPTPTISIFKNRKSWGFMMGYHQQNMTANFRGGIPVQDYTASMKGSNISLGGFFNYPLNKSFVAQIEASYMPLNVSTTLSDAACVGTTTNCNVNITYLAGSAVLKYYIPIKSSQKFWLGGGMDFLMPISKSTTVLKESEIGFNQQFRIGLGIDVYTNAFKKGYIPVQLETSFFPTAGGVSSSSLNLRFGYGILF